MWSSRFIKDLHKIQGPLWALTKDGVPWIWTSVEQDAFDALKEALSNIPLAYFNPERNTELVVDASPDGLGAVLIQRDPEDKNSVHMVTNESRMLTDVESRYS
jgi:hypothetical protein